MFPLRANHLEGLSPFNFTPPQRLTSNTAAVRPFIMEAASARYAGGYASRDRFGAFAEPANSTLQRYICMFMIEVQSKMIS